MEKCKGKQRWEGRRVTCTRRYDTATRSSDRTISLLAVRKASVPG